MNMLMAGSSLDALALKELSHDHVIKLFEVGHITQQRCHCDSEPTPTNLVSHNNLLMPATRITALRQDAREFMVWPVAESAQCGLHPGMYCSSLHYFGHAFPVRSHKVALLSFKSRHSRLAGWIFHSQLV